MTGFATRTDAVRIRDAASAVENGKETDRQAWGLLDAVIIPGDLHTDADYRLGKVSWFDPATGAYTQDTVDVLVRSMTAGGSPPPSGTPVHAVMAGDKDGYAVYMARSAAAGDGRIAVATASTTTKLFGGGAANVNGQIGKLIDLQTSGSGTASLVQTTTVFLVSTNNATDAFSLSTAAVSGGGFSSKNTTFYEVAYSGRNADDGTPIYIGQGNASVTDSGGGTSRNVQGGAVGVQLDQTFVGNKTYVPYAVPFAGNLASVGIVFNGPYEAEIVLLPASGVPYAAAPVALNLGGWKIAPYAGGGGLSTYTQIDPCYLNSCVVDYSLKAWDGAAVNNTHSGSVVVGDGAGGTKTLTFVGGLLTTVV